MKLNYLLFTVVFIALLSSCGFNEAKYYTPSEINAKKANVSVEELIAGRTKYINTCGECHRLYKPSRNTKQEWSMYLDDMQERAEISDKDKKQIFIYLTSEISE